MNGLRINGSVLRGAISSAVLMALSLGSADAVVIFSGTNGTLDFDSLSGSFTLDGLTVTLTASDGEVNATSTGLGVNGPMSGDDTNGIDTTNGVETLTFFFDMDVTFNSVTYTGVGVNDALDTSFNGVAGPPVISSGTITYDTVLLAGEELVLTAVAPNSPTPNNGVTITQFTVTAIPEPSSCTLLSLAGIAGIFRRRRVTGAR